MNTHIVKNPKTTAGLQATFIKFCFNFFAGLFMTPIYAMVAIPWLFSMFLLTPENGQFQDAMFKLAAWLSGDPSATNLNEGHIARAVIAIFLIIELPFIIRASMKGESMFDHDAKAGHRPLIMKLVASSIGWIVATIAFYYKQGPDFALMSIMLMVGTAIFITVWHTSLHIFRTVIKSMTQHVVP